MVNDIKDSSDKNLVERLFSAGAHFGFSKARRHPSVSPYLFGNKQGVDIFDLEKTSELIEDAKVFLEEAGKSGKKLLLVSTKEEVSDMVRLAADSTDALYVTNRWIGGTFTNFQEIKKRIDRLATLKEQQESGELDRKYTKKERLMVSREIDKLTLNFGGIATMEALPGVIVLVDPRHDAIAVEEARQVGVPVVAVMSSDCDVAQVTKPVVVNDSHRASVSLALNELIGAYRKGKEAYTLDAEKNLQKKSETKEEVSAAAKK